MTNQELEKIPLEEYKQIMNTGQKQTPLELLPELKNLYGKIIQVDYQYVYYNNQYQYVTDKDGIQKLDKNGQPIKRKRFNITIQLDSYELPNKTPRNIWLDIGASWGLKAYLPQLLSNLDLLHEGLTPEIIIRNLTDMYIKFQVRNYINKQGEKKQKIMWETVRKAGPSKDPFVNSEPKEIPSVQYIEW